MKTAYKSIITIVLVGLLLSFTSIITNGANASPSPVYYSVTGNYYDAISVPSGITWTDANSAAQSLSYLGVNGHLATITSQGENDFIVTNLGGDFTKGYWLGGIQPPGSPESTGGWQWVTGEPWSYTNWCGGEPNNHYGGDQGVHPYGWPEDAIQFPWWENSGKWNDFPHDIPMPGYVVEYPTGVENQPPIASFKSLNVIELGDVEESTFDGGHMVGGVIRFDPTASYDLDGEIIKYEWDFDNGTKFSTDMPNIYDITFEEARIYNVTLTVTDNDRLTNTFAETIDLTLKDGDLIFIRTKWWDIPFNIVSNEYTHVGMYIGGQWMIESILFGNPRSSGLAGVVVTPLSGWSYPSETYATLVRVKTANDTIRQEAVAFALSKSIKGQGYDINVWKKKVNKPNYYCSELIWAAYYKASKGKIDLGNKGKKGGVWPDDIIHDSVNTQIIGYHWEHNPL